MRAALGKSVRSGARRPYRWVAVRHSLRGTDTAELLLSILGDSIPQGATPPQWLLFDFEPLCVPLCEVSSMAGRKMKLDRFVRLSRQLFRAPPAVLNEDEANLVATYSARSLFPILADK